MRTECDACGAVIVSRVYLERQSGVAGADNPIFAETYQCGAVHLYGWVAVDCDHCTTPRRCPAALTQDLPASVPQVKDATDAS